MCRTERGAVVRDRTRQRGRSVHRRSAYRCRDGCPPAGRRLWPVISARSDRQGPRPARERRRRRLDRRRQRYLRLTGRRPHLPPRSVCLTFRGV